MGLASQPLPVGLRAGFSARGTSRFRARMAMSSSLIASFRTSLSRFLFAATIRAALSKREPGPRPTERSYVPAGRLVQEGRGGPEEPETAHAEDEPIHRPCMAMGPVSNAVASGAAADLRHGDQPSRSMSWGRASEAKTRCTMAVHRLRIGGVRQADTGLWSLIS